MEEHEQIIGFLGIGGVALILSFFVPGWVGAGFGLESQIDSFFDWTFSAAWWLKVPVLVLYWLVVYFGLLVSLAMAFGAACSLYQASTRAGYALAAFSEALMEAAFHFFVRAIAALTGMLRFPLRLVGQFTGDLIEEFIAFATAWWREEQELRCLYREEHVGEFRSYRAFKRYWQSLDENGDPPGADNQKKTDPYGEALEILSLAEPFTKAELKARYHALMKRVHTDHAEPNGLMKKLNIANETIKRRKGWQ